MWRTPFQAKGRPQKTKVMYKQQIFRDRLKGFWWTTENKPEHDKTNKMTCAPNEDSDQPGYPPILIPVFAVHFMGK